VRQVSLLRWTCIRPRQRLPQALVRVLYYIYHSNDVLTIL